MTRVEIDMNPESDEIDPEWWAGVFGSDDSEEFEAPERLSLEFQRMLEDRGLAGFQREVIDVLAAATSAMLKVGDWLNPFRPMMEFGDRRSVLPSDLTSEQIALLARVAPLIEQSALRARVADVAWFYGDRSNVAVLDMAVDAYRSASLAEAGWFGGGRDAWQRAFELLKRRGPDGRARIDEMSSELTARVLRAGIADRFRVPQGAKLLRENIQLEPPAGRSVAEHLVALAADEAAEPRLSRHLEREAAEWFGEDDAAARHGCFERVARTYIAEAEARVAADPNGGALVESLLLEKAIAVLRTLPRRHRGEHGLEELITELRERLATSRETAIEAMMRLESGPVDLSGAVVYARARVSGKSSRWEALAMFASLMPPMDAERTRTSAEELVRGSISRIFSSSTFARNGRKVAASPGSTDEPDNVAVWAEMVRTIAFHARLVGQGMVLPAQQVLTFEHAYSREFMARVCLDSPAVPEGHAQIWGAGLAFGLAGDYGPAVAVLVPQVEHMVRVMLKSRGAHTLFVDENGVESEKGLATLLDMPEAPEALGAGIVIEFKALLVHKGAANLRNDIAHGLLDDAAAWSIEAIYVWWSCLRMVVVPLWNMTTPADDVEDAT